MSHKIAHWIFPNLNTLGGRSNYVKFLIQKFSELDLENHVITSLSDGTNQEAFLNQHAFFYHTFDFDKSMKDIHTGVTINKVKELHSLFLKHKIQVLLIHSLMPESFIYLKLLLTLVNPDLKIILLIHDLETIKYLANNKNVDLFILKNAIFICPSTYIQNELMKISPSVRNIVRIPHGVITSRKIQKSRSNYRDFTFVGDFEEHKGLIQLVIAWARVCNNFPHSRLFLIGDGKLMNFVKRLVINLGIESKIVFTGWLNKEELNIELESKRFIVIPSIIGESFSLIAAEVQYLGLPAIASNNGALIELINDSINGVLVNPGNIDELAEALILLLEDHLFLGELSMGAYKKSESLLKPNDVIDRYLNILF
jgi:glycosyltransferase involved in cell wall biosynthesis